MFLCLLYFIGVSAQFCYVFWVVDAYVRVVSHKHCVIVRGAKWTDTLKITTLTLLNLYKIIFFGLFYSCCTHSSQNENCSIGADVKIRFWCFALEKSNEFRIKTHKNDEMTTKWKKNYFQFDLIFSLSTLRTYWCWNSVLTLGRKNFSMKKLKKIIKNSVFPLEPMRGIVNLSVFHLG